MTREELKKIILNGENAKVDFKSKWYEYTEAKNPKIDREFIRDIFALSNGSIHTIEETAYLIIGVMEKTDKREGNIIFDLDIKVYDFNKDRIPHSLDKFQKSLLQTLNEYAQPAFLDLKVEWHTFDDDIEIMVLSVLPHGRLISLSQKLIIDNNKTIPKGTIYYRIGESTDIATPEVIKDFEKAFAKNENKDGITIKQTHSGSGDNIARDKIVYQK